MEKIGSGIYIATSAEMVAEQEGWSDEDKSKNIDFTTSLAYCVPEVSLVKRTRLDRLPLLVSKLKTEEGRAELSKRLKNEI